jgi:hypothetical protein
MQPSKEARPSNEGPGRWVLSMARKVGDDRSWRDSARRQWRCCSADAGEEEREGGRGRRAGGLAGLLGRLGGMG